MITEYGVTPADWDQSRPSLRSLQEQVDKGQKMLHSHFVSQSNLENEFREILVADITQSAQFSSCILTAVLPTQRINLHSW